MEYVLSTQPHDFYPNKTILLNAWDIAKQEEIIFSSNVKRNLKIEDHHIYPLGAVLNIGQSTREIRNKKKHILNSPLNRTYITEYSNSQIRDKNPEQYFQYLSDVTSWGHSIGNTNWRQGESETIEDFQKRLLTNRYEKLLESIKTELSQLELTRQTQSS
jgi:hypothetical protein